MTSSQEKRKKLFMADAFTKQLKRGNINFEADRIARYGQGFSNLLQMAASAYNNNNDGTTASHSRHLSM